MLLSVISGFLCGWAFTNPAFFLLPYFSLVPFFYALTTTRHARSAILCSLAFALPFFGTVLWWLNELSAYVGGFARLAFLALVLYETLWLMGFGVVVYFLKKFKFIPVFLMLPAAFVVFEYLRSLGEFGVTAGGLAYSQTAFLEMIQIAKFTGAAGITFFLALVNCLLLQIITSVAGGKSKWFGAGPEPKQSAWFKVGRAIEVFFLAAILAANFIFGSYLMRQYDAAQAAAGFKIAVVQGSIAQKIKLSVWDNDYYFKIFSKLSREAHVFRPSFYVWPETALNNFIERRPTFGQLADLAAELSSEVIVGAPRYQGDKYFNSVFAFDDSGKLSGVYDKQRLVAFGEYLPLRFITYPFLAATKMYGSDYFPGKGRGVIELAGQRLGMMVCFESTMPEIARHRINAGATFLLTLTNDAWFGSSFALNQHLQAGILRAVENEVYLVQAANTGISAFIDGVGRVKDKSEVNRAQFLIGEVRPRSALASPTFYARHGEMLVLVCGVFLFVLLVGRLVFMEKA